MFSSILRRRAYRDGDDCYSTALRHSSSEFSTQEVKFENHGFENDGVEKLTVTEHYPVEHE